MNRSRPVYLFLSLVFVGSSFATNAQVPSKQQTFTAIAQATIHAAELPEPTQLTFESTGNGNGFTRIRFQSAKSSVTISSANALRRLSIPGDPKASTPDSNIPNLRYFHPDATPVRDTETLSVSGMNLSD